MPIRLRLTASFALATLLVLAGAGLFVYLRLRADLNDGVNASLGARANAIAAQHPAAGPAGSRLASLADPEEGFVQVLVLPTARTPSGRIVDAAGRARGPALTASELRRAARGSIVVERRLPGIDGSSRMLARPLRANPRLVVVSGQSLNDRNEALAGVVASFAVGGSAAIVLASLLGYLLASAGLAPVEAMRRRAREVSLSHEDERLPLPAAHDEVRRLGETLNEMLDRLRRSFERERRFVADASHELRTPVAVIKTELEGALRDGDCGPYVREALVAAAEECDRLAQLAEDLLVVAAAADGELPVRREALRARPLLEGVRDQFVDRAQRQGRAIRVDANGDDAMSADPLRVRQALGNLVDNALRHGAGEIVLRARPAQAGIELEVTDEGPGFAPEVAERAFERFARGDTARTCGGTGLGLAIVQAIAEAHGGCDAVVVRDAAVTTVRLWLPHAPSR